MDEQVTQEFQDRTIKCIGVPGEDCGKEFIFSVSGQKFFQSKGWDAPKRCKTHREKWAKVREQRNKERGQDARP